MATLHQLHGYTVSCRRTEKNLQSLEPRGLEDAP